MNVSKISVRYAKAFFLAALEEGVVETVKADIQLLVDTAQESDDLSVLLHSPAITPPQKRKILHDLFAGHFHKLSISLLNLLLSNKREAYLLDVARSFLMRYYQHIGVERALIISAMPLSQSHILQLKDIAEARFDTKVELETKVDKRLIGGFILRVSDQELNVSVAGKLKVLKDKMLRTPMDING